MLGLWPTCPEMLGLRWEWTTAGSHWNGWKRTPEVNMCSSPASSPSVAYVFSTLKTTQCLEVELESQLYKNGSDLCFLEVSPLVQNCALQSCTICSAWCKLKVCPACPEKFYRILLEFGQLEGKVARPLREDLFVNILESWRRKTSMLSLKFQLCLIMLNSLSHS